MLARVANSLYWTGRYVERSEHISRYLKVQYFSTFDAPMTQKKEIILQSILHMSGNGLEASQSMVSEINEHQILEDIAFNLDNPNSIITSVKGARENARSVRYVISSELWETINRYYHFINGYSVEYYKTRGLYDFTTNIIQNCAIIRSQVDSTLLHDNIWAFIKLGIFVERSAQIIRILSNKLYDINSLTGSGTQDPLTTYQWTITLKTLETYDMYRRLYRGVTNQKNVLSFLLTNPTLSRSLTFSLEKVNYFLSRLTFAKNGDSNLEFQVGKLANSFKFLEYKEIECDLENFLISSLQKIYGLNELIEKEYFKQYEPKN